MGRNDVSLDMRHLTLDSRLVTDAAGGWLKEQLENRHLSVRQVANELGVSTSAVYDWIADKTRPSQVNAAGLAELLGISVDRVRERFGLYVSPEGMELEEAQRIDDMQDVRAEWADVKRRMDRLLGEREERAVEE